MLACELEAAGPTRPRGITLVGLPVEIQQPATPEPLPHPRIDRHEPSRIAYRPLMPHLGAYRLARPARASLRRRGRLVGADNVGHRVQVQQPAGLLDGPLEPGQRFRPG